MAVFNPFYRKFSDYKITGDVWRSELDLDNPILNPYPNTMWEIRNTVRNPLMNFLFGEAKAKGPGSIRIVYPEPSKKEKYLKLPNIEYTFIPVLTLEAIPNENSRFLGWFVPNGKKPLSPELELGLTENQYTETVTFLAKFS